MCIRDSISANTKQQIKELDEKYNNNFKIITETVNENNKRYADNTAAINELKVKKLRELETKIDSKSDETHLKLQQIQWEVQQIRQEVRTKLASISNTPCNRSMTNEQVKNIKFNGTGDFPMEFIKELNEISREHYQDAGNIKWIARHLEGETAVWWGLVKDSINNFVDFTDAFINKYANEVVKEKARDHSKSISNNRIRSGYDRPRLIRRSRLHSSHGRRYRSRSLSEGGRKHCRSRTRSNERYRSPVCKRFPSYSADNRYEEEADVTAIQRLSLIHI